MSRATSCPSCGAKIKADRQRCPRCRAILARPDPAQAARTSRRLGAIAGAVVAAFVLVVAGLWVIRDSEPAATTRPPAATPLASSPPSTALSTAREGERPFLDASGAGAVAYASGDFASALERYQAAVAQNPRDAESLSNLGQVLVRLGRVEEALPFYRRAIDEIPDRWAYQFNLARALGLLGRWDESIATYRRAQQLFPNDYATTFNLGLALHKKGDDLSAIDEYKKAIALAPDDGSFHFALGISYERLQKPGEAATAYAEYLRLSPSAPDADRVRERIAQLTGTVSPAANPSVPDPPAR